MFLKYMTADCVVLGFALLVDPTAFGAQQTGQRYSSEALAGSDQLASVLQPTFSQRKQPSEISYVLGPGDRLSIHIVNFDEVADTPIPIELDGSIRLPLIGTIPVAGYTTEQVRAEITNRLRTYLKQPDVSISVAEFRSQPVSVIGAVRNPGVQQVQGQRTLLEMLSLAGGLDSTTAGSTLKITRRLEWGPIPLPGAVKDPTNQFSIAQVSIRSLLRAEIPQQNISVKPHDVVSVPRGESFFVIGEVSKPGGFLLNDDAQVTVLQALSMAGGLDRMAQPQRARILRRSPATSSRTEIPVDLNKILEGKTGDVRMQAEDILFIPNNVPKRAVMRAAEAAIQLGTGIAVFRRP